jgi:predicted Zn-dependent protease
MSYSPPKNQNDIPQYKSLADKPLSHFFKEPFFGIQNSSRLLQAHDLTEGIKSLQAVADKDPRDFESRRLLASVFEYQRNWKNAIWIRTEMAKLDPYNQKNLLQLGLDMKYAGDNAGRPK